MIAHKSIAIVSTIKHVTHETAHWIEYHLQLGVCRFFIFIDHPGTNQEIETNLLIRFGDESLMFLHKNKALEEEWKSSASFEKFKNVVNHFVTIRQALNIELLLRNDFLTNYNWVFHIDDDEFLYFNHTNLSLPQYLMKIPEKYDQIVLQNYEAMPENSDSHIKDINLFKKSPPMVSSYQLKLWKEKLNKAYYFTSYNHGKCGFRPSKIKSKGNDLPEGVHRFHTDSETTLECNFLDLAILHYPFPNFSMYLEKFSGFNRKRVYEYEAIGENLENFYTQSRKLASTADPVGLDFLFNSNVVYTHEEINLMKELKLVFELKKND